MTMIVVNINEAKAKLSEFLDAVAAGERVVICNRNHPVAELRAIEQKRTEPRPIGGGPYSFAVPDSFFEPMPVDWLDEFYNGAVFPETPQALPETRKVASRVAESPVAYGASKPRRGRR